MASGTITYCAPNMDAREATCKQVGPERLGRAGQGHHHVSISRHVRLHFLREDSRFDTSGAIELDHDTVLAIKEQTAMKAPP